MSSHTATIPMEDYEEYKRLKEERDKPKVEKHSHFIELLVKHLILLKEKGGVDLKLEINKIPKTVEVNLIPLEGRIDIRFSYDN